MFPVSNARNKRKKIALIVTAVLILAVGIGVISYFFLMDRGESPELLTKRYFQNISEENYQAFYDFISVESQEEISREDFIKKHENIYSGIEGENLQWEIGEIEQNGDNATVHFSISMDTLAGSIHFDNQAEFSRDSESGEFRMHWTPHMILPSLTWDSRVSVNVINAERGEIFDRNGNLLAGTGTASSVGFVPNKISVDNQDADIEKVAVLLDTTSDHINELLNASWVQEDSFVPIQKISSDNQKLIDDLLEISGILISQVEVRYYPLGEKAGHLIGYVQNISAEELKEHSDGFYTSTSIIGKNGIEALFEDTLRAKDGKEITIVDSQENLLETIAKKDAENGQDLHLTIDAHTQSQLFDLFEQDKSGSVAINPQTGEVLALVSTPTFDPNEMVRGISANRWDELNGSERLPLLNRFKLAFIPGSTMKGITGAIGLDTNTITPSDDFGTSGLEWQKDDSWGDYFITTLTEYDGPANLENALIYSDNIFFGKLALEIGADNFQSHLEKIGFDKDIPFEFGLTSSSFGEIETDIRLADSGYGQGKMLVNPVHLALLYSSFVNEGNILQPQLLKENFAEKVWIEQGFTSETAQTIKNDLIQVIEQGTGSEAQISGVTLAGKTGTAEIKTDQTDETGTELGWFVLFNADENVENPLLVVSMVEDVKDRGGSHYLVPKLRTLFE